MNATTDPYYEGQNYAEVAQTVLWDTLYAKGKHPAALTSALREFYTLLVLVKGEDVTLADVHNAWAMAKSPSEPGHERIVPFDQLSPEVQELSRPYAEAIRDAAKELREVLAR